MATLSFETLQQLDLPLAEMYSVSGFPDVFLSFPYEVHRAVPEGDDDLVVLVGRKNRAEAVRELCEYSGRVVAAFSPSDIGIGAALLGGRESLSPNFVAQFTANNELTDSRSVSLPLGIKARNLHALDFVRRNHGGRRDGLCYGNFTLNGVLYQPDECSRPHVRFRLVDQLKNASWVHLDISCRPRRGAEDLLRYYAQTVRHRFVLSPPGHGLDCYRTWEALYLGAIPVAVDSAAMSAFKGLPILFVDDYGELSEEYLERCWRQMASRSFEVDRMLKSWYRLRFLEAISTLREPRFVCLWADESRPAASVLRSIRSARAAGAVGEAPVPPFTAGDRRLMSADTWSGSNGLCFEQADGGLKVVASGGGRDPVAKVALRTVVGAPFRLKVDARPEAEASVPLAVKLTAGDEVVATAEVGSGDGPPVELDFVARSERTLFTIGAAGAEPGVAWLLRDLAVSARFPI
jgi:hypothetical protein